MTLPCHLPLNGRPASTIRAPVLIPVISILLVAVLHASGVGYSTGARGSCTEASPFDENPDSAAIQDCLDSGGVVELIPNECCYYIDATLVIGTNGTHLTTEGTGWALLMATESLQGPILYSHYQADSFAVSHLTLYGRKVYDHYDPHGNCAAYGGENAHLYGWSFVVDNVRSLFAACGTGLAVEGTFEIKNSLFAYNGYPEGSGHAWSWADGLTVSGCFGGWVHDNEFWDNTDVDLVVGGGHDCVVENNYIAHETAHGFAGLHVGWFPGGGGDHAGSLFRENTIESGEDLLAFGIAVGFEHWWYEDLGLGAFVTHAGSVVDNVVVGAVVGMSVDGIGDGYIAGNSLSNQQGSWGFGCSGSYAYTAHYFGAAVLQAGWQPVWFFAGQCGSWSSTVPQPDDPGALVHGRRLDPDDYWLSANGIYRLTFQGDGNLVLYDTGSNPWSAVWDIGSGSVGHVAMRGNGNFAVYESDGHTVRFSTSSAGYPGAYVVVQNDGNLVLYSLSGSTLWSLF